MIARKEVEDRIDEANKRSIKQQQSTNLLLSKIVEMQSDTIVLAADTQRRIGEKEEKEELIRQKQADERVKEEKTKEEREARYREEERNH